MKASVYTRYGTPDVLRVMEITNPTPKENQVLVRVFASTVNRTDCAMLSAKPWIMRLFVGLFKPRKPILGTDFAGKIEAIGNMVTKFSVGDEVFGFDDMGLSSHAQYLVLSENKSISLIPKNISYAIAAASCEGAHYAYNFIRRVKIQPGHTILVNGATGAIGSAMVQFLKHFKVEVTAVCDTKNIELVKSLGADRIIDYLNEDFTQDKHTYDFIFDAVGKSSFSKCKHLLKFGGGYISSELGIMAQNVFLPLITPFFGSKKVYFPIPSDIKGSLLFINSLLEAGAFKPVVDRTFLLENISNAFEYVSLGFKTGNVVIEMK